MQLFYNSDLKHDSKHLVFDKDESRHIAKVLRKSIGDSLHITNGEGLIFEGKLISNDFKRCEVEIVSVVEQQPLPYYLHILIAPTKNIDRFEWFLEKSTEIGVSEITPIICDNSERKIIKIDRCERIIESAMKQSLKSYKPKLNDLTDFQSALELFKSNQVLIAHCEPQERVLLKDVVEPSKNYTILIGPEGDFSSKEIENALSKGCKPISLGDSRLRTETAGVVACHSVNFINQ